MGINAALVHSDDILDWTVDDEMYSDELQKSAIGWLVCKQAHIK